MITLNPKQKFLIFCLEIFREEKNISGKKALEIFNENNIFDYLKNGFDVLHTQGKNYILADILDFLKHRQ